MAGLYGRPEPVGLFSPNSMTIDDLQSDAYLDSVTRNMDDFRPMASLDPYDPTLAQQLATGLGGLLSGIGVTPEDGANARAQSVLEMTGAWDVANGMTSLGQGNVMDGVAQLMMGGVLPPIGKTIKGAAKTPTDAYTQWDNWSTLHGPDVPSPSLAAEQQLYKAGQQAKKNTPNYEGVSYISNDAKIGPDLTSIPKGGRLSDPDVTALYHEAYNAGKQDWQIDDWDDFTEGLIKNWGGETLSLEDIEGIKHGMSKAHTKGKVEKQGGTVEQVTPAAGSASPVAAPVKPVNDMTDSELLDELGVAYGPDAPGATGLLSQMHAGIKKYGDDYKPLMDANKQQFGILSKNSHLDLPYTTYGPTVAQYAPTGRVSTPMLQSYMLDAYKAGKSGKGQDELNALTNMVEGQHHLPHNTSYNIYESFLEPAYKSGKQDALPSVVDLNPQNRTPEDYAQYVVSDPNQRAANRMRWAEGNEIFDAWHSGNQGIREFDPDKARGTLKGAVDAFISKKKSFSDNWNGVTYDLEAAPRNTFDASNPEHIEMLDWQYRKNARDAGVELNLPDDATIVRQDAFNWGSYDNKHVARAMKDLGFDSWKETENGAYNLGILDSSRIKSKANTGEYNPDSKDIYRSIGGLFAPAGALGLYGMSEED